MTQVIPNEDIAAPPPEDDGGVVAPKRQRRTSAGGHTPNSDVETERALIATALTWPRIVEQCDGLAREHFVGTGHGAIWSAICDIDESGLQPEPRLVVDRLATDHATDDAVTALTDIVTHDAGTISGNAAAYADIVLRRFRTRRALAALTDAHGRVSDGADPLVVISRIAESMPDDTSTDHEYLELDDFLAEDEPDHDWVIPGLLEHGDRSIITARAGTGKTTFQRQFGVMSAAGLHPFTAEPIDPVHVLFLDTENSKRQSRRKLGDIRRHAHGYAHGYFHLRVYGHSINLADAATRLELCRTVERLQPGIILAGPLYKLAEGDPKDEQVAKAVADCLDQLRGICGSALSIEAHSPYPVPGTKPTIRPYGASLWERWPEFGWFLAPDGKIEHWRGQRDERDWPTALVRSTPWPWMPAAADEDERPTWDGPTHCIEAIAHYLNTHPAEELSGRQLEVVLRAGGNGYRTATVLEAAERAAAKGLVNVRTGPRKARIYRHADTPKLEQNNEPF